MKNHDSENDTGRAIVAAFIGSVITAEIFGIVFEQLSPAPNWLSVAIRLSLTAVLAVCLWRGLAWARWLAVVLFLLATLVPIIAMFQDFMFMMPVFAVFYLTWALILASSEGVGVFMQTQRARRRAEPGATDNPDDAQRI